MSCFWDTLLKNIKKEDITNILHISSHTPLDFCSALQINNCKTDNVLWNGNGLKKQQLDENYEHIKDYKTNTIRSGYDCSICDPFLLLITELLQVEIIHYYNSVMVQYTNKEEIKYKITIHSDKGHMW